MHLLDLTALVGLAWLAASCALAAVVGRAITIADASRGVERSGWVRDARIVRR